MRYLLKSFFLLIILYPFLLNEGNSQPNEGKEIFRERLHSLNRAYKDSLQSNKVGQTISFFNNWGDRFWKLVQNSPNHELAPEAAQKALSIYAKLDDPNIIEEKLTDLSIHDRAMSGVLPYWDWITDNIESTSAQSYTQKLLSIVENSRSEEVKIAAHYQLARWFNKRKYYDKARAHLNKLEFTYNVYATSDKYGEEIKKMRAELDSFSPGKKLPTFNVKMLDGTSFTDEDLKGKVTFLYFYGSTCGSCVSMYPKITELYKQYRDQGFQVVGFGNDWRAPFGFNTREDFKQFAEEYDISFPQAKELSLWDSLNVQVLSTGYLINKDKEIVRISLSDTVTNATEEFEDTSLREAVSKLVRK